MKGWIGEKGPIRSFQNWCGHHRHHLTHLVSISPLLQVRPGVLEGLHTTALLPSSPRVHFPTAAGQAWPAGRPSHHRYYLPHLVSVSPLLQVRPSHHRYYLPHLVSVSPLLQVRSG